MLYHFKRHAVCINLAIHTVSILFCINCWFICFNALVVVVSSICQCIWISNNNKSSKIMHELVKQKENLIWAHVLESVSCSTSAHHVGWWKLIVMHLIVHHIHWHCLRVENVGLLLSMLFSNSYGHWLAATFWYHIVQRRNSFLGLLSFIEPINSHRIQRINIDRAPDIW